MENQIFDKVKTIYESALKSSGYETTMKFEKDHRNNQKSNRKRKIIWFNPPFNQQVKTNICKTSLKLVKKHFIKNHKFNKIFNNNTIKIKKFTSINFEFSIFLFLPYNHRLAKYGCLYVAKIKYIYARKIYICKEKIYICKKENIYMQGKYIYARKKIYLCKENIYMQERKYIYAREIYICKKENIYMQGKYIYARKKIYICKKEYIYARKIYICKEFLHSSFFDS